MDKPVAREEAFSRFVAAKSTSLLRAAFVLLGSREEAEDAVQATLLRTLRRWAQAAAAPEAYSRVVLINICRERWRHRARHPERAQGLIDGVAQTAVVSFTDAIEHRHLLVSALRGLPVAQREVLVCRYLLDASVADTAKMLGVAEGTVKSATSRGLDQLQAFLPDYESEGGNVRP